MIALTPASNSKRLFVCDWKFFSSTFVNIRYLLECFAIYSRVFALSLLTLETICIGTVRNSKGHAINNASRCNTNHIFHSSFTFCSIWKNTFASIITIGSCLLFFATNNHSVPGMIFAFACSIHAGMDQLSCALHSTE